MKVYLDTVIISSNSQFPAHIPHFKAKIIGSKAYGVVKKVQAIIDGKEYTFVSKSLVLTGQENQHLLITKGKTIWLVTHSFDDSIKLDTHSPLARRQPSKQFKKLLWRLLWFIIVNVFKDLLL
ncbi:MAG: hypothetical protein F6K17_26990 [Okeania sp. SIO3C4]|nr:hypothetical protein [Okeania sp. SIO3C4]